MPQTPSEENPKIGRSTESSSRPSAKAAPTTEPDPRQSRRRLPPLSRESEQPLGPPQPRNSLAHQALLLLAQPNGQLKPEFQEWESLLSLEPESLVPVWWPHEESNGRPLSSKERIVDFQETFTSLLSDSPRPSRVSDSASPAKPNLTPHSVLQSLLQLRSAVVPEITPTLD